MKTLQNFFTPKEKKPKSKNNFSHRETKKQNLGKMHPSNIFKIEKRTLEQVPHRHNTLE